MLRRISTRRPMALIPLKRRRRSRRGSIMLITVCRLHLHDFLFYASREMGRLYETEKYLHNYGLTYALGLTKTPYTNLAQVPRYAEELNTLNEQGIYVTPAHPLRYTFAFHTFKMANVNYYSFTPP